MNYIPSSPMIDYYYAEFWGYLIFFPWLVIFFFFCTSLGNLYVILKVQQEMSISLSLGFKVSYYNVCPFNLYILLIWNIILKLLYTHAHLAQYFTSYYSLHHSIMTSENSHVIPISINLSLKLSFSLSFSNLIWAVHLG